MAAPNNRQMNALPKDGKHRHLRPQEQAIHPN